MEMLYLFTKLNMKVFSSYLEIELEPVKLQSEEVNPPNIKEFVSLMIVSVFFIMPHLE